jgi:hypothetical protein
MPSTDEELKKALKAFRKRMNLTQLDEDSRLGYGPIGSQKSKIVSIQPPAGFGREIWDELADKGYLKNEGHGFYLLTDKKWSST